MLIALKAEGRVYLAQNLSDLPVCEFDKRDYILADNVPLWKVKNGCVMGCDNELEDADLFRYDPHVFRGGIDICNLLDNIAPSMLEKLAKFKRLDKDGKMQSHFVIAQGVRGFHLYGNGLREELDDYFAFGNGHALASSSLDMTEGLAAAERIKKAYEAVEASLCIPAYPIAVTDTRTMKLQIIDKP